MVSDVFSPGSAHPRVLWLEPWIGHTRLSGRPSPGEKAMDGSDGDTNGAE